jgi:hypothetical protein
MELSLFAVLLALGIVLIILGYWTKEGAYSLLGFSFLFILGVWVLLPGNLEVNTGTNTTYTYLNSTLQSTAEVATTTRFNDNVSRFFGLWLTICGAVGIAITTAEIKRGIPK